MLRILKNTGQLTRACTKLMKMYDLLARSRTTCTTNFYLYRKLAERNKINPCHNRKYIVPAETLDVDQFQARKLAMSSCKNVHTISTYLTHKSSLDFQTLILKGSRAEILQNMRDRYLSTEGDEPAKRPEFVRKPRILQKNEAELPMEMSKFSRIQVKTSCTFELGLHLYFSYFSFFVSNFTMNISHIFLIYLFLSTFLIVRQHFLQVTNHLMFLVS